HGLRRGWLPGPPAGSSGSLDSALRRVPPAPGVVMTMTGSLLTDGSPYQGYAYSYPHKTAYRRLSAPVALGPLWAKEDRTALFLYFHVPFCEMRCGFCNLFTQANPREGVAGSYLEALERQVRQVRGWLGPTSFARLAIGGGTPTALG